MTEERETEVVAGTVSGILEKGPSKWQVLVRPDGSQYDRKLWTKSPAQHEAASALIGSRASFRCNVSYWDGPNGQVRSLWIDAIGGDSPVPQTHSDAAGGQSAPQRGNADVSPKRDDPTRDSIEKQTALIQSVALHVGMETTTVDNVLATADRFYAFLQGTASSGDHQESGGDHWVDREVRNPGPFDEDVPFRWVDRWEVQ